MDQRYRETVQLLLNVAPFVFLGPEFAMKGGAESIRDGGVIYWRLTD